MTMTSYAKADIRASKSALEAVKANVSDNLDGKIAALSFQLLIKMQKLQR